MMHDADHWQATRHSLLARLKDADNSTGWQEFFDTYGRLIYGVALKSGLREAEAEDALQETAIAVARHIPEFKYDPAKCSFKTWLLLLARQRIVHQFRKRNKPGGDANRVHAGPERARAAGSDTLNLASDDATQPATVDRFPDPAGERLEVIWDQEWNKHLLSRAVEAVKKQVSDRQFQIFDLYVLQERPVREVARALRVRAAQVYLAKHRVGALHKKELKRLESEM